MDGSGEKCLGFAMFFSRKKVMVQRTELRMMTSTCVVILI